MITVYDHLAFLIICDDFYRASAVAASPVLATIGMSVHLSVRPSVRPCVCPSHADIV